MNTRLALVLVGAWIMGTVAVSVVATENFYTVDRLLSEKSGTGLNAAVERIGQPQTRELLRFLSSELNRLYFRLWNRAQIAIGALTLWIVVRTRQRAVVRWTVTAMFAAVVVLTVWLTPEIVSLGRSLDFVPREPPPPGMSRFWVLHAAYTSLEMLKLAAGVVVAMFLVRS